MSTKKGAIVVTPQTAQVLQSASPSPSISFRVVKALDISYVMLLYFLLAVAISIPLNKLIGPFDPLKADQQSVVTLLIEIILHIWLCGIIIYTGRNIVEKIPSPFDGLEGVVHTKLKELANGAMFTYFLLFFQTNLRDKLVYLHKRMTTPRNQVQSKK